jgi:hypothetical protein
LNYRLETVSYELVTTRLREKNHHPYPSPIDELLRYDQVFDL